MSLIMYDDLILKAKNLRQDTFNAFIEHGEAHLGGSFSMIEMLIALYEVILKDNDKFILSKAHASFPLCILLKEKGFNPRLTTHLELDSENGIHCTTGSLGHGLPIATGMAIARKRQNKLGKIYVLISDGECQEGTTWESLLIGAKHNLDNLIVLIDYNKIQSMDFVKNVLKIEPLKSKFIAFGCSVSNVDGHDVNEIINKLKTKKNKKPNIIIANTIKGKGISFMENNNLWHYKNPNKNELIMGLKEIEKKYA